MTYFKDSEVSKQLDLQGVIDLLFDARQGIEESIKRDGGPNVVNLDSGAKLTGEGADAYFKMLDTIQGLLGTAVYHLERLPEAGGDLEGLREAVREAMEDERPNIPAEEVHSRLELRHEDRLKRDG